MNTADQSLESSNASSDAETATVLDEVGTTLTSATAAGVLTSRSDESPRQERAVGVESCVETQGTEDDDKRATSSSSAVHEEQILDSEMNSKNRADLIDNEFDLAPIVRDIGTTDGTSNDSDKMGGSTNDREVCEDIASVALSPCNEKANIGAPPPTLPCLDAAQSNPESELGEDDHYLRRMEWSSFVEADDTTIATTPSMLLPTIQVSTLLQRPDHYLQPPQLVYSDNVFSPPIPDLPRRDSSIRGSTTNFDVVGSLDATIATTPFMLLPTVQRSTTLLPHLPRDFRHPPQLVYRNNVFPVPLQDLPNRDSSIRGSATNSDAVVSLDRRRRRRSTTRETPITVGRSSADVNHDIPVPTNHPPPTNLSSQPSLVVAREVSESSLEQERERIIQTIRDEITSSIAHAELVHQESDSSEIHRNSNYWVCFAALLILVGVITTVSVVVTTGASDGNNRLNSPSLPPAIQSTSSSAPTTSPIVYLDDGRTAFTSTPQLYAVIDAYHELLVANASGLNTSDVAVTYGFPMGTWDVSRISDFSRALDQDRDQVLDPNSLPMKRNIFNEDLSGWDMSNAVTISGMFAGARSFLGVGLDNWDVGNVKDFSYLFKHASVFNANVSSWDTSSAVTMDGMFLETEAFDGDLSTFNVSNVQSMAYMFRNTKAYKGGDLTRWDVGRVHNMRSMFEFASKFQGNISTWDTSRVTQMQSMFLLAFSFNGDIAKWSVDNVTNMAHMFSSAEAILDANLSGWNTSSVIDMSRIFGDNKSFNGDVSMWDTSRVESFEGAFYRCQSFTGDLSKWKTGSATIMSHMFYDAHAFSSNVSSWDTSKVTDMKAMFTSAISFNIDLSGWNVSRVVDVSSMFGGAKQFNHSLCAWAHVLPVDASMGAMFGLTSCVNLSDPTPLHGPFCANCNSN